MIKLIIAEGCSAISGVEQLDYCEWSKDPRGEDIEYSEHTWPALLWKDLYPDARYYPTARSGSSNMSIRRRIVYYVKKFLNQGYKPEEILVCIQWSSIDRIEFSRTETWHSKNTSEFGFENLNPVYMEYSLGQDNKRWLKKHNFDKVIHGLYRHQYLDDDLLYYTYSNIDYTNLFLNSHKIKNIQSAGFDNLFKTPEKNNKFLIDLIEQNQNLIHNETIPQVNRKSGFFQYCFYALDKKYLGPSGHPLLEGHRVWYEKIKQWAHLE